MKKGRVIIIIIFILIACAIIANIVVCNACISVSFETGIYPFKNWGETVGTHTEDAIQTEEVARNYAVQIFEGMERPRDTDRFVPQETVYVEADEAWEVTFREKAAQSDTLTAASSYSIVLRKEDAMVMSIQFNDCDGSSEAYTGAAIPNEVVAIKVATEIFATIQRPRSTDCFVPRNVFYDVEDEIWIVSFWEDSAPVGVLPAVRNYCIAIQKEDGKVVRIWCEE